MISAQEKARRILNGLCFLCGKKAEHEHHVIPKSMAGPDVTIPLCTEHHAACHGLGHRTWHNHSELVKAGIKAARKRGVKIGIYGQEVIKAQADDYAKQLRPTIDDIRDAGHTTVRAIAAELNARGIETARGGNWHPNTVQRLLKRIETA